MSYTIGNLALAYLMLLIPAFASGLLWLSVFLRRESYRRRFAGWRRVWEMWLSSALLSALLFGIFYWYLFWQPFYGIAVQPDGSWSLQYRLPARSVLVTPAQIQTLAIERDWLPVRSASPRQVIRIQLQDGPAFTSAPLPRTDAEELLQQLNRQLSGTDGGSVAAAG
jgi:hypothetical protein